MAETSSPAPGEMVWNKMMFESFSEIWNNRDYYGFNIRDDNAPWYKQFWQTVRHTFGDLAPIIRWIYTLADHELRREGLVSGAVDARVAPR
jgi:hypothetical protein